MQAESYGEKGSLCRIIEKMSLSDLEVFLAEIAEALSLVYVFVTFAQNGIVGVILYIIGWSFISMVFETVGKEIPSPLKIIWRIFQDLVEIFV